MRDLDSTLIRRAQKAVTFPDMVEFAATLDLRPLGQLLEELPELAKISAAKFDVATNVLRRRFSHESLVDQEQLRIFGLEIAGRMSDNAAADRIRRIFGTDHS